MQDLYVTGVEVLTAHGLGTSQLPDIENLSSLAGTTVPDLSPAAYGYKGLKRLSRASRLSCLAIGQALQEVGLDLSRGRKSADSRTGFLVGSNHSNLDAIAELYHESQTYGPRKVNPGIFPETVLNVIGGHAAIYFGLSGVNVTISNGRDTGIKSLAYACSLLREEQLARVVVAIVNLLPPDVFETAVRASLPSFESVVVLVLESGEESSRRRRLAKLDVQRAAETGSSVGGQLVSAEHAVLASAIALRELTSGSQSTIRLLSSCCTEGDYLITLEAARENLHTNWPVPDVGTLRNGVELDEKR
ncbi:hypothetical protein LOK74_08070 [Brevibacillus humidisoli]|uniref:beta-ketoacyl synthase N-terminal-like domain-containing protein n=1 Tax=Brevibacillus humidisoli TaxID=2895522 RepID=UPI001E47667C|nr:beta-ketoacyl synthase N-terminal-like domain-containing protein [Brevibacillus humidisoli]UFJ42430.1 hypothetical protein LOK74_08070 [Brevibacillus humidisoli]